MVNLYLTENLPHRHPGASDNMNGICEPAGRACTPNMILPDAR